MVIGDDIAVCRDDDTRTGGSLLRRLHLLFACAALTTLSASEETSKRITEEIVKGVALHFYSLDF